MKNVSRIGFTFVFFFGTFHSASAFSKSFKAPRYKKVVIQFTERELSESRSRDRLDATQVAVDLIQTEREKRIQAERHAPISDF